jgi:hypothetical protein
MAAPAVRQRSILNAVGFFGEVETQKFCIGMSDIDQPGWRCTLGSDVLPVAIVICVAPLEPGSKEREACGAFGLR